MGADMELVRQFNSEMASIYENKPPISKAKMASITRFAVKALKYYKHVTHAVEKFIEKCHPDYKLPGLYVLDSIIRQSRHQFGLEKDLFGPRFQKSLNILFQNIYQCPQEEKPKVVRVLNLWQKNGIYPPDVISPLVDMASTSSRVLAVQILKQKKKKFASSKPDDVEKNLLDETSAFEESFTAPCEPEVDLKKDKKKIQMSQDDEIQVLKAQLEQQRKQQELLQQQLQMQIMATKQQSLQLQLQQQQMQNKITEQIQLNTMDTIKAESAPTPGSATTTTTQNTNQIQLLNQIQELTQQLEKDKATLAQISNPECTAAISSTFPTQMITAENHTQFLENFQQLIQSAKGIMLKDPRQQNNNSEGKPSKESSPKFNQALLDTFEYDDENVGDEQRIQEQKNRLEEEQNRLKRQEQQDQCALNDYQPPSKKMMISNGNESNIQSESLAQASLSQDDDAMQIDNDSEEYNEDDLYRPEQSSFDGGPPLHGRSLEWSSEVVRSEDMNVAAEVRERIARESREVEQKFQEAEENWKKEKSVMPPPVMNRLTVASTTLWIGRLPRGIHPSVLHNLFSEYGEVKTIDMIEMRGCAFITMGTRFHADRALRHARNRRIEGCDVKVAWGQPKNLQEFNKFWDELTGCAFIPWGAFKPYHIGSFTDGAIIDKETLPIGADVPTNINPNKGHPENEGPAENNPPFQPPFQRGIGNPNISNHGMPPGIPHPDMLPPPPPMMPPGFRGQFPPMPLPGILPIGLQPPMPPVGILPWPNNMQPPPRSIPSVAPANSQNHNQSIPKPLIVSSDQSGSQQHQECKEFMSLLPPPPPIPGGPSNIRGPPFLRPDIPTSNLSEIRHGFVPLPRGENMFNRPPLSERQRFPHVEPERFPLSGIGRGIAEQPVVPLGQQIHMWNNNDDANKEPSPMQGNEPFNLMNNDDAVQPKHNVANEKVERNSEHCRSHTPEKSKDDRERRSRDDYREFERKEKKDRNYRDDNRSERRERDDFRSRRDRDDRDDRRKERDTDDRNRNRKNRDDRNDRSERDYRGRDERESRRDRSGREKYGKDEFGRDESNRDEDRSRREEVGRDEERLKRQERTPDKARSRDRDSSRESSRYKKESSLEKQNALPGFKPAMQPIDKSNGNTSPKLPTVKSGFKSTMQTIKPTSFEGDLAPVTDEFKIIDETVKSSSGKKSNSFVPFSIYPLPQQDDDDDGDDKDIVNKDKSTQESSSSKDKQEEKTSKCDELYDPLESNSPPESSNDCQPVKKDNGEEIGSSTGEVDNESIRTSNETNSPEIEPSSFKTESSSNPTIEHKNESDELSSEVVTSSGERPSTENKPDEAHEEMITSDVSKDNENTQEDASSPNLDKIPAFHSNQDNSNLLETTSSVVESENSKVTSSSCDGKNENDSLPTEHIESSEGSSVSTENDTV